MYRNAEFNGQPIELEVLGDGEYFHHSLGVGTIHGDIFYPDRESESHTDER